MSLALTPSPSPKKGEGKRRKPEVKTRPNRPGNCYTINGNTKLKLVVSSKTMAIARFLLQARLQSQP